MVAGHIQTDNHSDNHTDSHTDNHAGRQAVNQAVNPVDGQTIRQEGESYHWTIGNVSVTAVGPGCMDDFIEWRKLNPGALYGYEVITHVRGDGSHAGDGDSGNDGDGIIRQYIIPVDREDADFIAGLMESASRTADGWGEVKAQCLDRRGRPLGSVDDPDGHEVLMDRLDGDSVDWCVSGTVSIKVLVGALTVHEAGSRGWQDDVMEDVFARIGYGQYEIDWAHSVLDTVRDPVSKRRCITMRGRRA